MDVGVRLLGPPAVRVADTWVPMRPTKPHALFAYVAYRGVRVRREEAASLLWPDADAEHAHGDLRQALRSLSRGPFGPLFERDRGAIWLTVDSDVPEFRRAAAERRWVDAAAARRLGALAWGNPALEVEVWPDARRLLGLAPSEAPAPSDEPPSDEATLAEVERFLA